MYTKIILTITDEKVPQIQENSNYPDWLFDIGKKV